LYRKYKPTTIFTGTEMLKPGYVLITGQDGSITEITDEKSAGDGVEMLEGILSPGFINAHCHIELSHMRSLVPAHTGLVDFVQQVMSNRHTTSPERRLAAMQEAEKELYQSGTVAVGDICNGTDSLALKQNSPLYWHNFVEASGFVDAVAEKRLTVVENILDHFRASEKLKKGPTSTETNQESTLAPHAPYSVSKELFRLLNEKTSGQTISIHNQEAVAENELYQYKTGNFLNLYENFGIDISGFSAPGKTSLQSWAPYFTHGQQIISVHNTFTSEDDLDFIKQLSTKFFFCICANANLYIENALPPIDLLLQNSGDIVMGTDSYASNRQLNMMEEIKTIQKHFPHIALPTVLRWATFNGALALGIQDKFGSFEKGKKPGLVLINEKSNTSRLIQ
jgi:cytosine/adenosine deaminase-related metal-dependent hydrolase